MACSSHCQSVFIALLIVLWAFIVHSRCPYRPVLDSDVIVVYRPEGRLQKQVENSTAMQERKGSDAPIRPRGSHSVPRLKVLTDVNGNSPRASANHDKLHAVDVLCPEQTPFSRLSRSASGM